MFRSTATVSRFATRHILEDFKRIQLSRQGYEGQRGSGNDGGFST